MGLPNLPSHMRNQKLNFWLMVLVGVPAFIWLLVELVRVLSDVIARSGVSSVPSDGVIQHKIGELLVATPLFLILLLSNKWAKDRVLALAAKTRLLMIAGGLLNGLAWYSLRDRLAWSSFFRVWCLILLAAGLFGSQIATWVLNKSSRSA